MHYLYPWVEILDHPLNEIFFKSDASDLTFVHYALLILNCRNIKKIRIEPSEKLNKKRKNLKKLTKKINSFIIPVN